MSTRGSTASLSIRQIKDVNLAWMRSDLGQLGALQESIEEHGLQLPVLMTTDMIVVDGARRLVACERLGFSRISVLVTSDWEVVKGYFAEAKELAAGGWPTLPMQWADLTDLFAGPMKALYGERYRQLRKETIARKAAGHEVNTGQKHLYTKALAEVLGFEDSDLRTIREIYATLNKMARPREEGEDQEAVEQRHGWAAMLLKQMEDCQANAGERLYAIQHRVRGAFVGKDPGVAGVGKGRRTLGDPTYTKRKERATARPVAGREIDGAVITNLSQLLSQLGDTASHYTHVRPSVRLSDATAAATTMRTAIRRLNALVRVVESYGSNPNYLEESQS